MRSSLVNRTQLRYRRATRWPLAVLLFVTVGTAKTYGEEAEWIWSPDHDKTEVPVGSCYFRKSFSVTNPTQASLMIAADDSYELYLNGRRIARGEGARKLDDIDIGELLKRGVNTIAVRVRNQRGFTAAFAARVMVKEDGQEWSSFSTDDGGMTNRNGK